jgi:hypothetical protein
VAQQSDAPSVRRRVEEAHPDGVALVRPSASPRTVGMEPYAEFVDNAAGQQVARELPAADQEEVSRARSSAGDVVTNQLDDET